MTSKLGLIGIFTLFVLATLTACGGGGGSGSGGSAAAPAPAAGFTKTVVLPVSPTGPTSSDWTGLFLSSNVSGARYQSLVRAQELQGSGPLRSLAFRFGAASTGNSCPNVTIKLVHRAVGVTLGTTFANNVTPGRGAPMTVFGPATLTIPAGAAGSYFTIPLSGAFNYNGVDNLVVDIESDACTANTVLDAHDASPAYTALIYAADRAAATGSAWNSLADMKLTFAGGDDRVQSPGTSGTNAYPFTPGASGRKIQLLYYPAEIDGAGPVTGLAFPMSAVTNAESYTITVKFGHSTLTALTNTFANNFNNGVPVTVANAVTFEKPAGAPAGRYLWVPLPDGTFNYNGTDNLIIEIEATPTPASTTVNTHQDGVSQRRLVALSGAATGSLDSIVNDIQLRFAGGGLDAITPAAMSGGVNASFPFLDTNGKIQLLYRAAELGTPGTISKFACRAGQSGPTETGFNYTVVMSHGTASTLGSNFAANLTSPVTVFNGTLNLNMTVHGDWIEVPLTTPFAYNGRDNLVLEIGGIGGSVGGVACALDSTNTTLYAGRHLFGTISTATAGGVGNLSIDTRFTLQ